MHVPIDDKYLDVAVSDPAPSRPVSCNIIRLSVTGRSTSQKLLTKTAAQLPDRRENFKVVVGLVERLREAVSCHQVDYYLRIHRPRALLTGGTGITSTTRKLPRNHSLHQQGCSALSLESMVGDPTQGRMIYDRVSEYCTALHLQFLAQSLHRHQRVISPIVPTNFPQVSCSVNW